MWLLPTENPENINFNIKVKTDLSTVSKYVHSKYSPPPSFLHPPSF